MKPKYEDFIGLYEGVVDPEFCNWICRYMDNSTHVLPRNFMQVKDQQICFSAFSPQENKQLMEMVDRCLFDYVSEYPYLSNFNYVSSLTLVQKTEPCQGYHLFHGENLNWDVQHRTLAWMVYLNDVKEGGETEFQYQKRRVRPKKGTVLIWPGGFTHLHRGNPPLSGNKYIATGWYQGSIGLREVHTAGINDRKQIEDQ